MQKNRRADSATSGTDGVSLTTTQRSPPAWDYPAFSQAAEPQELLDQTDKNCLYVAKRNGRNQLVYFEDVPDDIVVDESQISRTKKPDDQATAIEGNSRIPYAAVASLLSALSYRDAGTAAHSKRVSELSITPWLEACCRRREIYVLEVAALLHDIGKIGVPDSILLKPGPLTKEEWQIMSKHDDIGVDILAAAFSCPELSEIVRCHHAFYGANNQDLPTGEAIPLASRIIALADAYDAMVSDRVYRKGMPPEDAFAELRRCSGTQFDPQLVERLIEVAQCRQREWRRRKGFETGRFGIRRKRRTAGRSGRQRV
ncbi:MAG: HD domain-containing protein [Pirellulaceae bacterium]